MSFTIEQSAEQAAPAESEEDTQTVTITRKIPRGKKNAGHDLVLCREQVPVIEHPADDPCEIGAVSDQTCACGSNLIKTGESLIRKLLHIPGHFEEHLYRKPVYKCPNCSGDEDQCRPATPAELASLPDALVTNDLLAELSYNKFGCGLPLHRQNVIFENCGVHLSKSSECRRISLPQRSAFLCM